MRLATFVFGSVALLIQQYAEEYKDQDLKKTLKEVEPNLGFPKIKTYDFIVVGGGTAGCLLAGRLSEHFNTLLLEAGGTPVPQSANPYLNLDVSTHWTINNLFTSIPQTGFVQEWGGIETSRTGRMLGGSGSHNGNVFNRGSPHDWDTIANLTQDDSWSYSQILKHFKNIENFVGRLVAEEDRDEFYGKNGPVTVDTDVPAILPSWFQAGYELGIPYGDPNGHQVESFTPVAKSMKNGQRDSSYTAFIKPFESTRKTLTIHRYSEVEEVLINNDKIAYGVAYKRHGSPQIAHASKEIIISAGTFSSPMLLLKSGIGPKSVLEEAEIPLKANLPGVAQNFRDHGAVVLPFKPSKPDNKLLTRVEDGELGLQRQLGKFQRNKRTGYFTRLDVGPQAFISSNRAKREAAALNLGPGGWPDIQIVFLQKPVIGNEEQELLMEVVLNRLASAGSIGFNSTKYKEGERNDTELALVDFRSFTDPNDVEALVDGIVFTFRILEDTTPFKSMNVSYTEDIPAVCSAVPFRTRDYWRCYIKQRAVSWLHVVGTCSMGADSDPMAVVDPQLRVRGGIKRLRVADASVVPRPTNANMNAPTMAVAEKLSQMLIEEYGSANPPKYEY